MYIPHSFWSNSPFSMNLVTIQHDDVFEWKHFPRYWQFVRETTAPPPPPPPRARGFPLQRPVTQMSSLICSQTNVWANNRDTGDLRRHSAHSDVTPMSGSPPQRLFLICYNVYMLLRGHVFTTWTPVAACDDLSYQVLWKWHLHETMCDGVCIVVRMTQILFVNHNVWLHLRVSLIIRAIKGWRHGTGMLSSSLAICEGNPPLSGAFHTQRTGNAELWCFHCS